MEFAIDLRKSQTKINPFGEIGMAIKVYDRNTSGGQNGILAIEGNAGGVGDDLQYLRNFSNFRLVDYVA